MTAQMRISKVVMAALLGGGVSTGSLVVPNASHAQAPGAGAVIKIDVQPQGQQRRVIDCDVRINIQNLPPGATADFTTTEGRTFRNLGNGNYCLRNGQLAAAGGGPPPPVVLPPGGNTGNCTTTGGMTPKTICH